jgi:ankyrin repeat protein
MKTGFFSSFAFAIAFTLCAKTFAGAYEDMEEALVRGDGRAAMALVKRGMDVNTVDRRGNTLLIQSVQRDLPELFDFLIRQRARVNLRNQNGETALSLAAYLGRANYVQRLLDAGAEVDFFGWSPLSYAAYNGHTDIVNTLIKRGANVNAKTETGSTALFFAARFGHVETVRTLLKHGADLSIANENGETAVDWAMKGKSAEIEDILRAAGARSGKTLTIELPK